MNNEKIQECRIEEKNWKTRIKLTQRIKKKTTKQQKRLIKTILKIEKLTRNKL